MNSWYELEIIVLEPQLETEVERANFYKDEYDRSDSNAGFDLHSSSNVTIEQTPQFIPFGINARLLKVQRMNRGDSNDFLKTASHFWLMPHPSIFKSGLIMANSAGVIDKSYRGELKASVWSLTAKSTVTCGDRLFQIVAPDMGWIRNIRIVKDMTILINGRGNEAGSMGK